MFRKGEVKLQKYIPFLIVNTATMPSSPAMKKEKDKMLKAKLNFEIVRYVIGSIFKLNFVQALNDAVQAIKLLV